MGLFSLGKSPFSNPFPRKPTAGTRHEDAPAAPCSLVLSAHGQTQQVTYRLRRSARARRVGLRIDAEGLEVVLPQRARLDQTAIEHTIREHEAWIVQKLALWQQRAVTREARRPRYTDGGIIPLLGEPITLRTLPHSEHRRSQVRQMVTELWISGPAAHDDALLKAAVHTWLKKFAAALFRERLPPFVQKLGRAPSRVSLNAARTRWGSCSRDGSIRLNWRLVQYAPELIDYVIAHELAHLTELNHSPRFWAQLETLMPDYRQWQRQLADTPDVLVD